MQGLFSKAALTCGATEHHELLHLGVGVCSSVGVSNPWHFTACPAGLHPAEAGPEPWAGPANLGETISRKPHLLSLGFLT